MTMSLLRTIRQQNLIRSVARTSTATAPTIAVAGRRFAHGDYGSGATKSNVPKSAKSTEAEHPGPPPPSATQQGNGQQQQQKQQPSADKQQSTSQQNQSDSKSSSKPQPKILSENPPAEGEQSEEVAQHNKEVSQRADRADSKVKNEDTEKDKVPKDFWKGE